MIRVEFPYDSVIESNLTVKARATRVSAYDATNLNINVFNSEGVEVTRQLPTKDWETIKEVALEELQTAQEEEGI